MTTLLAAALALTALDQPTDCRLAAPPLPDSIEIHLLIEEPTFKVEGIYRATSDGQMRIDTFTNGQRVFAEALHNGKGREWRPGRGVAEIGPAAEAALRHGIELPGRFFTFDEMEARGHRVQGPNMGEDDGQLRLDVTLHDGHKKRYWLDTATCRVMKSRDVRAFHPSNDPTEIIVESRHRDYRDVDGFTFSFVTEQWGRTNDTWLGTTEIRRLIPNADLSDVRFDLGDLE